MAGRVQIKPYTAQAAGGSVISLLHAPRPLSTPPHTRAVDGFVRVLIRERTGDGGGHTLLSAVHNLTPLLAAQLLLLSLIAAKA